MDLIRNSLMGWFEEMVLFVGSVDTPTEELIGTCKKHDRESGAFGTDCYGAQSGAGDRLNGGQRMASPEDRRKS